MSAEARPISPTAFALAIQDLPVATLNNKALEIRNSMAHLLHSNEQLQEFADQGDQDCIDAIAENRTVMSRMEERISLLRAEVEGRGLRWYEDHAQEEVKVNGVNEDGSTPRVNGDGPGSASAEANQSQPAAPSGRLNDEQLQRLLAERLGEQDDNEDDGVHL